eukprot:8485624-Pyramimonas_sp.AAC.1
MEIYRADCDSELNDPVAPKNSDAKSQWTTHGFHDPDIAVLNRTVPTPPTSNVPVALQCLSPIKAKAWVGDVESAVARGLRNQWVSFCFTPCGRHSWRGPRRVAGPPGWRRNLLTSFKRAASLATLWHPASCSCTRPSMGALGNFRVSLSSKHMIC